MPADDIGQPSQRAREERIACQLFH
jgi:hypothetical protein